MNGFQKNTRCGTDGAGVRAMNDKQYKHQEFRETESGDWLFFCKENVQNISALCPCQPADCIDFCVEEEQA